MPLSCALSEMKFSCACPEPNKFVPGQNVIFWPGSSTIGSAVSHKAVLENPDLISKTVLSKGLDAGTAFEILSIDIADVDVGKNIGAELQTDQAERLLVVGVV